MSETGLNLVIKPPPSRVIEALRERFPILADQVRCSTGCTYIAGGVPRMPAGEAGAERRASKPAGRV